MHDPFRKAWVDSQVKMLIHGCHFHVPVRDSVHFPTSFFHTARTSPYATFSLGHSFERTIYLGSQQTSHRSNISLLPNRAYWTLSSLLGHVPLAASPHYAGDLLPAEAGQRFSLKWVLHGWICWNNSATSGMNDEHELWAPNSSQSSCWRHISTALNGALP